MAYCEDCGLSSCYERGGYCETSERKFRAKVKSLHPRVAWFRSNGVMHYLCDRFLEAPGLYPQLNSDEWIEVVW